MAPEKIDMLLYDMKPNFDHIRKTMGLVSGEVKSWLLTEPPSQHKANFTLKVLMWEVNIYPEHKS